MLGYSWGNWAVIELNCIKYNMLFNNLYYPFATISLIYPFLTKADRILPLYSYY